MLSRLLDSNNTPVSFTDSVLGSVGRSKMQDWTKVHAVSPETPGSKNLDLKILKVQIGFGCNMGCSYCSQANQRELLDKSDSEVQLKVLGFISMLKSQGLLRKDESHSKLRIEFWGGETLIYWRRLRLLVETIRAEYPDIYLLLFTNGTLFTEEMIEFAHKYRLHFCISHDGPDSLGARGRDPLLEPKHLRLIKLAFEKLNSLNLISFNCTLTKQNFSVVEVRKFIAYHLDVAESLVAVTHDLALAYDDAGLKYLVEDESEAQSIIHKLYQEFILLGPFELNVGQHHLRILDFFNSIVHERPVSAVGQKCQMDLPSSLAVDLDGNVLTCQNTTIEGGHKIGHILRFDKIELITSFHFTKREACQKCPVVQICKGGCMFMQDPYFTSSCDQLYAWGRAYFAYVFFMLTGLELIAIEGQNLRGRGVTRDQVLINE